MVRTISLTGIELWSPTLPHTSESEMKLVMSLSHTLSERRSIARRSRLVVERSSEARLDEGGALSAHSLASIERKVERTRATGPAGLIDVPATTNWVT